ncbi:hypothetical protein SAMN05428988_0166 [Chitinophaga sp. YR573]|uniref:hypothetical protein n=1 Tax=Chitinophaga sp. YR573 TaxID=1881040 RepID=UPI0008B7903A|nr:hypothetical protein [Chitinophaga sp. YR573]SEV88999.1 hypothetical protein SAMN05428988_0166 [Chitinophaga sp. YR573]
MRNRLLLLFMLFSGAISAQKYQSAPNTKAPFIKADSGLTLPADTLVSIINSKDSCRRVAIYNNNFYRFDCNLQKWIRLYDETSFSINALNYIKDQFSIFNTDSFKIQGIGWFKEPENGGAPSDAIRIQRGSDTTSAVLRFYDQNGTPRGYIGMSSRKNNAIAVYNPYGSLRFFASDTADIGFGIANGGSPISTRYHNGKWLFDIFKGSGVKDTAVYTIQVSTNDSINAWIDNGLYVDTYYENEITVTGNYTFDITTSFVIVDAVSATITLPRPTLVKGRRFFVRTNLGSQTATLFTPIGQIETSAGVYGNNITITGIPPNSYISDGTNWRIAY